jgi:hypothetical protein
MTNSNKKNEQEHNLEKQLRDTVTKDALDAACGGGYRCMHDELNKIAHPERAKRTAITFALFVGVRKNATDRRCELCKKEVKNANCDPNAMKQHAIEYHIDIIQYTPWANEFPNNNSQTSSSFDQTISRQID